MSKQGQEKIYEMVTDQILTKLENGVAPWKKPWQGDSGLKMPKNLKSGKPYRGINVFMLAFSGYNSRYWLTYKQAQAMGGQVRKKEKGTHCIFWNFFEKEDENGNVKKIPYMKYYSVFNLDQIDGIEDPESNIVENDFDLIETGEKIVNEMQKRPAIEHKEQSAFYRPSSDTVNIPELKTFHSPEGYYSTLFHELTHSTGHSSRLNRKGVAERTYFGSGDYSFEELVAEMGAAFLCVETGIFDNTVEQSASYIKSWLSKLKENKKWLVQASGKAQKAVDFIMNRS